MRTRTKKGRAQGGENGGRPDRTGGGCMQSTCTPWLEGLMLMGGVPIRTFSKGREDVAPHWTRVVLDCANKRLEGDT